MALSKSATNIGNALTRQFKGFNIRVRELNSYIHATDMCKVGKKRYPDYIRLSRTQDFIKELESVVGIPTTKLIQSNQAGNTKLQGTWVHPHIEINLAQWVIPIFAVKVSGCVSRFISGDLTLVQYVVEQANDNSGMINNITTASNPESVETLVLVNTYEKDIFEAKYECERLQKKGKGTEKSTQRHHSRKG